jgi:hypothetical protein
MSDRQHVITGEHERAITSELEQRANIEQYQHPPGADADQRPKYKADDQQQALRDASGVLSSVIAEREGRSKAKSAAKPVQANHSELASCISGAYTEGPTQ